MRRAASESVFVAISDPTRRRVLELLGEGQRTVSQLQAYNRTSISALSQHLGVLRRARLVRARKDGRLRYYSLNPNRLREVRDWVAFFDRFWDEKLDGLEVYLERGPTR